MFERFTPRAHRVPILAQEEARALRHHYIGTEHILLGLLCVGEGVAAESLKSLGISLEDVRCQVKEIIGQGQQTESGHIPFTPRAKKVLELSLREALQLGHNHIGTEHILLGLIREGEGVAAQVLVKLGAELTRVRQAVMLVLSEESAKIEGDAWTEFEISLRRFVGSKDSSTTRTLLLRASQEVTNQLTAARQEVKRLERVQDLLAQQLAACPTPE